MITLTSSVGKNGINKPADVKIIQRLLNASDAVALIAEDGRYGPATFKAILQYQMSVFQAENHWDGLIGRNGKTLRALADPVTRVTRSVRTAEANAQAIRLGGFGPLMKAVTAVTAVATGGIAPLKTVTSRYEGLSGERWCLEFPTSKVTADLASPFRDKVEKFRAAMAKAGVDLEIAATFRPSERAWLMHWAYDIAHGADPRKVPSRAGININWVHVDAKGNCDLTASKKAAQSMNSVYRSSVRPSLTSLHITGNAIDMSGFWTREVSITDGNGKTILIPAGASFNSGMLHKVAATYGVVKRINDKPHWSVNGS